MQQLNYLDYSIIALYIILALGVGNFFFKKAGESMEEFFLSGRSMPWWLIGISMAATNFSIDTPLAVAKVISKNGLPGAWLYWSGGIAAVAAAFLFSRLWRRAKVITDNELIELRYSGNEAAFLRFFKGVYFGILINGFVLGWVFLALSKVASIVTPWDNTTTLLFFGAVTLIYTVTGGFYGVILTDLIQYFFAITGSVLLAYLSVQYVGGVDALTSSINNMFPNEGFLNFTPDLTGDQQLMPLSAFMVLILVKWWAHKYSDGGGKHIQRMSSAKDESNAVFGTFFYSIFTNVISMWPWIITALCAVVVFQDLPDPEKGYPMMMIKVLPHGILGLCVMSLIGAFMSTIDTHLNLGASYFINDIYKRFFVKDANTKHYVIASRITVVVIMALSMILSTFITSVASVYFFILTFASGAGLIWVLRWFWWRINAYSEISSMIVSGIVASYIKIAHPEIRFEYALCWVIGITTPIAILVTFLTPKTKDETLKAFYERVQPSVFGWRPVIDKFKLPFTPYFKHAWLNFVAGVALLFTSNIGIGMMILKSFWGGFALLLVSAGLVWWLIKRVRSEHMYKYGEYDKEVHAV